MIASDSRWMALVSLAALSGCVTFAAPPPLVTLGGPDTAGRHQSELGLATGMGAALFSGAHSGGIGWLGRWRYGLSDQFDLGVDAIGSQHSDKETFTGKFAARFNPAPKWRLELGFGGADDSAGKSLGLDAAVVTGTADRQAVWNYYGALRVAAAKGFPGDVFGSGETAPPDALFGFLNVGATARVMPACEFVFEGGLGAIKVRAHSGLGTGIFVGAGLRFHVGKEEKR